MNLREKMVHDLVLNLEKEDIRGKLRLLTILSKYGHELKNSLPELVKLLNNEEFRIRIKTCDVLKEAGSDLGDFLEIIFNHRLNKFNREMSESGNGT